MKRTKRRKPQELHERIWHVAIAEWYDWYLRFVAPPPRASRAVGEREADAQIFEIFARRIRSNIEHGNPLLQRLLNEEARRCDWPASIHAIICDMPPLWQGIILGTARDMTQEQMGTAYGVSQPGISAAVSLVKSRFVPRVLLLGSSARALSRRTGVAMPAAMATRPAVVD